MTALALLLGLLPTLAMAANCSMIHNDDQRAYCVAREFNNQALCMSIKDHALRVECRVELGYNKAECITITDPQKRQACYAKARAKGEKE